MLSFASLCSDIALSVYLIGHYLISANTDITGDRFVNTNLEEQVYGITSYIIFPKLWPLYRGGSITTLPEPKLF